MLCVLTIRYFFINNSDIIILTVHCNIEDNNNYAHYKYVVIL